MARFTALQRVRLKRNIYQAAQHADMREAFATGQTGFVSRVPPNNEHIQHDDNCIYYIYLDSGFDRIIPTYRMQADGWYVMGDEIEDIDEQARLEAVAAEMRQISDEYWNVGQAATQPRPTVAPPMVTTTAILEQLASVPVMEMPQSGTRARFAEANPVMEIADPNGPRRAVRFSPRFTPSVVESARRSDEAAVHRYMTEWSVTTWDSDSVQEG